MPEGNKCGHAMCNCPTIGNDDYCSDHCREMTEQKIPEIECDCGHPNCGQMSLN